MTDNWVLLLRQLLITIYKLWFWFHMQNLSTDPLEMAYSKYIPVVHWKSLHLFTPILAIVVILFHFPICWKPQWLSLVATFSNSNEKQHFKPGITPLFGKFFNSLCYLITCYLIKRTHKLKKSDASQVPCVTSNVNKELHSQRSFGMRVHGCEGAWHENGRGNNFLSRASGHRWKSVNYKWCQSRLPWGTFMHEAIREIEWTTLVDFNIASSRCFVPLSTSGHDQMWQATHNESHLPTTTASARLIYIPCCSYKPHANCPLAKPLEICISTHWQFLNVELLEKAHVVHHLLGLR